MTRLLVECTYVFEHPKVNSGIQRVVRNVIRELPEADETVECIPVAMLDGTLYQVHSLAPLDPRPHSPLVRLRILVERAANYFWLGQRTLEKRRPFRSSPWARRLLYVACRLFAFAFLSIPLRLLDRILGKQQPAPVRATPLEHRAGDQLVLLDSSWHADFFPLAERLKSEGVGIVSVIYDLIPLTHPQFCDAGLVKVFNHWFDWIAATADGYVAISETIRDEVRAEMLRRIGPEKVAQRWFDYFHLGSELDLVEDGASVEPDLLRMFKAKAPVFLMVSTIEPRKNHGYLLDAFERAWAQGSQARLCIAGRIGWKCEALVERVRQHPELNKRLFMFNDLSDKSLEYAYSHAASLVFPSYVEGFGLPLVEAMQRGLPAMGSDIPVFREIGGEFMAYFDLADPHPPVVPFGGHVVHRARLDLQLASTGFSLSVFKQFRELAAEADVVNYHFPWPFMDLVHFLTGMNKPSVVTYHSDIIRQRVLLKLYRPLMGRFLHSVDRIAVASPNYFSTSDVLRQYREKTRVITYGLDKACYPKPAAQRLEHWREKLGPRFFLFVGVMRYYKGLHILLDALQGTDYPVVIVGAGPLQAELYAQAAALGLRNVHFLGRVDDEDKVALLQLSYAMVFPSHLRSEAFGISLLEGAMYGKPMISSEIGTGTSYINIHGETGLVVPPSQPAAFRQAMRWLWEHPQQAEEMGRNAEARYRQLFTAEEMGRRWSELYRELLEEKASSRYVKAAR